jgi:carbon storage regulator
MLVLSRKRNESIVIADDIVVTIVDIQGDKVRLGIQAPREVSVHRREVYDAIMAQESAKKLGNIKKISVNGKRISSQEQIINK